MSAGNVFEALRDRVPIADVVRQYSEVKGTKARCVSPDHLDENPSMHVYDVHVHCFGCGFRGDVTDVWAVQREIERPIEAALDLAREFNIRLPEMNTEAKREAQKRREKQDDALQLARSCHAALEKHPRVREWWERRGFGTDLQQRFLLGTNKGGTEAVIPFWHRGCVEGLIRRRLNGEPRYVLPKAEAFPEGYRPLFIPGDLKGETFLVEGYIDALAVVATGRVAIAVGGTALSDAQEVELRSLLREDARIYILPDRDENGADAARTWARMFFPKTAICAASYGEDGKDIADTFERDGAEGTGEHLDRLVKGAQDLIDIEIAVVAEMEGGVRERLAYATEHIVPLLARIQPDGLQDATADIVAESAKLKKSWLNKAIKDETERLRAKSAEAFAKEMKEKIERRQAEYQARVEAAQDKIDALFVPGVLGRLRDTSAAMHNVYGDKEPLELALLVALGAQLEPLPNGRPLGASILLTAEAGRGKNHIIDAAVKPLPEEFYFAFEIASGQSLYYKADEDPEFLKHTFAYPNEIEGAEALWEFLRPMLSKGWAKKIVTAKDADGNMTTRTIIVEGPVTIAIPTIRNKTDEQLQTRLLVAELPDYPGRVKQHSAAVSEQLLPTAAAADHSEERFLWQEGLRQLTSTRRVVFPLRHPDFALDDDKVSHGARLWANLLSIMASHAWLEQKNRRLLDLSEGDGSRVAIEATPDDYEAAYRIFNKVCRRTVVNLSDTHRKILGSLHDLHGEFPNREGFTQREIAEGAKVSLSTVSDNKTFLATSAKFIKQTESGLALVEGADPSWWATGDIMAGLPTPEKVRSWWEDCDPPPEGAEQAEHAAEANRKRHTYAGNGVRHPTEQEPNTFGVQAEGAERGDGGPEHVRRVFGNTPNAENGLGKAESVTGEAMFGVFGGFEGNPQESVSERASKGNWASGVNAVPVSFDARPGEMPTVAEPRDRREQQQEGSGEERVRAVAEGLHRLFQEYPEYRERRPGQIGCRLYMSQYTPFVPKDEEVEAAMTEVL